MAYEVHAERQLQQADQQLAEKRPGALDGERVGDRDAAGQNEEPPCHHGNRERGSEREHQRERADDSHGNAAPE